MALSALRAFLQDVESIYDIVWAVNPVTGEKITYGEVRLLEELQFSVYNFEAADVEKLWEHLRLYEAECQALSRSSKPNLLRGDPQIGAAGEDTRSRCPRWRVAAAGAGRGRNPRRASSFSGTAGL